MTESGDCSVSPCPEEQGIPVVTPFSKIGSPPEKCCSWWQPCATLYALVMTSFVILLLVALLPIIILFTVVRRIWSCVACSRYHTPPSSVKVAVIGGGWSGVQIISRLQELGVNDITGFERYDDVGGTWHPKLSYHSIQIHGAMWATSLDKCKPIRGNLAQQGPENDCQTAGAEMNDS